MVAPALDALCTVADQHREFGLPWPTLCQKQTSSFRIAPMRPLPGNGVSHTCGPARPPSRRGSRSGTLAGSRHEPCGAPPACCTFDEAWAALGSR